MPVHHVVNVRHECECGEVFEGQAPLGRVTIKTSCPKCHRSFIARRVPDEPVSEPATEPPAPRGGKRVRKVAGYDTSGTVKQKRPGVTPEVPTREHDRRRRSAARAADGRPGAGDSGTRPDEPGGREPVDELGGADDPTRHGPAREPEPAVFDDIFE